MPHDSGYRAHDLSTVPSYDLDLRTDDGAVEYIERVNRAGTDLLEPWYARAAFNLSWAQGRQFLRWENPGTLHSQGGLVDDPRFEGNQRKPYIATNFLRRYLLSMISRVISTPFTWRTKPATDDIADQVSASALDRILPMWWDELDVDGSEFVRALWVLFATNVIFAHAYWDTDKSDDELVVTPDQINREMTPFLREQGDELSQLDDGQKFDRFMTDKFPDIDPHKMEIQEDGSIRMPKGAPALEWLTGFDVIEDPTAKCWQDSRWVLIKRRMPVDGVRDKYGKAADHVTGMIDREFDGHRRLERDNDYRTHNAPPIFETTEMLSFWLKPGVRKDYPDGVKVDMVEGRVVDRGKFPYDHGQLPIIPIYADPDINGIRPRGVFDDLVNLQDAYNHIDQEIVDHINKTVAPSWMIPEGSLADPDLFLTVSPAAYEFDPSMGVPTPFPVEQLAPHVIQEKAMIQSQIEELAGITDPTQGRPSSKATSGRAILALNQRFDMLFSPMRLAVRRGLESVAQQVIALWAQFESGRKQVWSRYGENSKYELFTLVGESLVAKSQNNGRAGITKFDVNIEIGEMPSRNTVIDWIEQTIQLGIINPVRDAALIARALNDGVIPKLDKQYDDRVNAGEENELFASIMGEIDDGTIDPQTAQRAADIPLKPGDDHAVHLESHFAFIKGGRMKMFKADAKVFGLQAIQAHTAKHQQALQRALANQQKAAAGMQQGQAGNGAAARRPVSTAK